MSDSKYNKTVPDKPSGLQDTNRLVVSAVVELTAIVEVMHNRISPLSSLFPPKKHERIGGITGIVYDGIRSVTERVGRGVDLPLNIISKTIGERPRSASQDALVSAINGVIGDHLENSQSPLAIPMALKQHGKPLDMQRLAKSIIESEGKLTIMIHGLCMNDRQWTKKAHNHGHRIADDLGHTIVYLHYNTGRHISENGRQFSHLLDALVTQLQSMVMLPRLAIGIVAHSMGGLVARSAHYYGKSAQFAWPEHLQKIVFLGTPHHGAPLEKAGTWIDLLLGLHPYSAPLKRISQVRSAGITDLRHGNIVESDWHNRSRFDVANDTREALTLPDGVDCYAIATTSLGTSNQLSSQVIGDGLVPLSSALGKHSSASFTLHFKPQHQWVGKNISHVELLSNKQVYDVIRQWLASDASV